MSWWAWKLEESPATLGRSFDEHLVELVGMPVENKHRNLQSLSDQIEIDTYAQPQGPI